jgi:CheY-like chemotaxis protein
MRIILTRLPAGKPGLAAAWRYTAAVAQAVAFLDDLMFLSRIREAARPLGVDLAACRRVDELVAACRQGARMVFVDLDSPRVPSAEALDALRADPSLAGLPVVGFVSHVHAERIRAARDHGITRVLARSAFVQELPALLAGR